jgi:hypothetical protein
VEDAGRRAGGCPTVGYRAVVAALGDGDERGVAGTGAALAKLSARIDTSAAKISRADANFNDNEGASAAELRAVGGRVV